MKTESINFNDFLNGNFESKNKLKLNLKINSNLIKFFSAVPYPITSKFGQQESFRSSGHSGYDFAMPKNTPLKSIQDGTVYKIVDYGDVNAGKTVMIQWEDGTIAIYGHLNKFANIHEGQKVSVGDLIGYSGNSGHVVGENGYHLHFGLKQNGEYINPSPYIEYIQNMNNPEKPYALTDTTKHVAHNQTTSFSELFQQQSNIYEDIFKSFKLHLINLSTVDYSIFNQYFQDFFKSFS